MRYRLLIFCLFFAFSPTFAQKKNHKTPEREVLDLAEALAKNFAAVEAVGLGGHSGESIKLTVRNTGAKTLRLKTPQGQLMEPANPAEQTLVVAETQWVTVAPGKAAELLLKTFCTQAGDLSPNVNAVFAVGAMAPEAVCSLLKFLSEQGKTDSPEAQSAVWCVTNRRSVANIGDKPLAQFVANLVGKNTPAYTIRRKTEIIRPGQRADLGKAMLVEGNYIYTLERTEQLYMALHDGDGKFLKQISKVETMTAGEHHSGFHLEVYNIPPGKYIVRVQTKKGKIIKDIEVDF